MADSTVKSSGTTSIEEVIDDGRYELPEGQRMESEADASKLPDVKREASQELADHLNRVEDATQEDGTLKGHVEWVGSPERNKQIVMLVRIPSEADLLRFFFDKPKTWDDTRYEFVRFARAKGYDASNIAAMNDDRVTVDVREEADEYHLVVPDTRSLVARGVERLGATSATVLVPLVLTAFLFSNAVIAHGQAGWRTPAESFVAPGMAAEVWFLGMVFDLMALSALVVVYSVWRPR